MFAYLTWLFISLSVSLRVPYAFWTNFVHFCPMQSAKCATFFRKFTWKVYCTPQPPLKTMQNTEPIYIVMMPIQSVSLLCLSKFSSNNSRVITSSSPPLLDLQTIFKDKKLKKLTTLLGLPQAISDFWSENELDFSIGASRHSYITQFELLSFLSLLFLASSLC